jgi:hypothetical protein
MQDLHLRKKLPPTTQDSISGGQIHDEREGDKTQQPQQDEDGKAFYFDSFHNENMN